MCTQLILKKKSEAIEIVNLGPVIILYTPSVILCGG